jgi:hypothetical protein
LLAGFNLFRKSQKKDWTFFLSSYRLAWEEGKVSSLENGRGNAASRLDFGGVPVTIAQWELIREVMRSCGLSRNELANTACELLGWRRANGKLKTRECVQWLEQAEVLGLIELPLRKNTAYGGSRSRVRLTRRGEAQGELRGNLSEVTPVLLERIASSGDRDYWKELVARYHYLGYRVPFGAQLRYFIQVSKPESAVVGCLQFSSPAWRVKARDQWVGWDEEQRQQHLQQVVQNSRFLILPWVRVKRLASHVLALASRVLPPDWEACYGARPVLLETFVEQSRYPGTCYQAANWICVGHTAGRGRMDRHKQYAEPVKSVWVYPLHRQFRHLLTEEPAS